ncbi:MAG: hypothetical protein JWR01_564, partial [Subtercola sp.]|nr:hypothetical protein [Subtercola sp.]
RMVEEIGIAGTPSEVVDKLARYEDLVDWLVIYGGLNVDGDTARANIRRIIEVFKRPTRSTPVSFSATF